MCKCESMILVVLDMANAVAVSEDDEDDEEERKGDGDDDVKNAEAERAVFGIDVRMIEDRMMLCTILNDISGYRVLVEIDLWSKYKYLWWSNQ